MPRILIISNMYPSSEKPYAGIFIKNQYEYLKVLPGLKIDLIYMQRTFTGMIGSLMKYLAFYFRFFPKLFRKYDVIHVHAFAAHFILAYQYKFFHPKTKIIVTFHGSDYKNFKGNSIVSKIFKVMAKKIDCVLSVGTQELKYIRQYIEPKDSKVLCAGVDAEKFYPVKDAVKEYDFLFIGSFYNHKGVDIFIDAIKLLNDKTFRICFVGSGEYLEAINELQKNYNISIFLNIDHDKLVDLYNKAKFLVMSSRLDAFGLVVTESMYSGTPVIIAPTGGLLDQVIDNFNGYILKENTPQTLADAMKKAAGISDEDYIRLCQNALNSNKQFSLQNVCKELVALYNSISKDSKLN
jgi:glycosyltransferase involved in cell wall biosynthesis